MIQPGSTYSEKINSPAQLGDFVTASVVALGAVALTGYVAYKYWQVLGAPVGLILLSLIALQLIYQWIRAFIHLKKIRDLSLQIRDDALSMPVRTLTKTALRGIAHLLLFSYGVILMELVLIALLLSKLSRMN